MTSSSSPAAHPLDRFGVVGAMLLRTVAGGRISPSYLFEGTDSLALHEAARAFAAGLLAGLASDERSQRALQQVLDGTHADLHELRKDKATVISVAALAPMLERAHSTPFESPYQVFVIDPAEAMDPAGIARYLKSLEEPPETTVFVLVTTRAERLPDTVLSRCRRVRFPPLSDDVIAARLRESSATGDARMDEGSILRAVRAAGGSLERAQRFADHELPSLGTTLIEAATSRAPQTAQATAAALAKLERIGTEMAAADGQEASTKRQHVRALISDVLRILVVEARECAASREHRLPPDLGPDAALDLIAGWGRLDAALAANVTPAAVLLEAVALLRRTPVRHLSR